MSGLRRAWPWAVFALWVVLAAATAGCRAEAPGRVCGQVTGDDGNALVGAAVRAGGAETRTDREGRFCLAASPGAEVRARADGFCPAPGVRARGDWASLTLARQLVVGSAYQVGFDAPVTLRAALRCPLPGPPAFRWDQLAGPSLADRAQGWNAAQLRLRTHPLGARTARPDVLALSPREAGQYVLRATASGGGRVVRAEAEVTAASVLSGLLSVSVDTAVYADSGRDRPAGTWRLVARPPDSSAAIQPVSTADGGGGVARVRLDRTGLYELFEERSGTRLVFEAGPWDTVPRDCDRPECHPSEQAGWEKTRHARALAERLERATAEPFGARCLPCHTVGYDPGAQAAGFDDAAEELAVHVRDGWPGGAAALPRDLQRLADVWCIACHGPGRLPEHGNRPMIVRAGVCAPCHDAPPKYAEFDQWRGTRMARPVADAERLGERCAGCHTAQGAVTRLRGRIVRGVEASLAEPITCAVCHVAHTAEPKLLRRTGTAALVSGVLFEAGKAAVCLGCHQAQVRADAAAEEGRRLPEAPQADVLFGAGAFGARGQPYRVTPNLCVDCHMARCVDCHADSERYRGGHTFRAMPFAANAPEDCDGDGRLAPLAEEIDACLAVVRAALAERLGAIPGCAGAVPGRDGERLEPRDATGGAMPACAAEWAKPEQAALYRAAHDAALIERDGSKGAHNPGFSIRVLRTVLQSLGR
jgi:hypothetical protein